MFLAVKYVFLFISFWSTRGQYEQSVNIMLPYYIFYFDMANLFANGFTCAVVTEQDQHSFGVLFLATWWIQFNNDSILVLFVYTTLLNSPQCPLARCVLFGVGHIYLQHKSWNKLHLECTKILSNFLRMETYAIRMI